jgi:hypothetical protein
MFRPYLIQYGTLNSDDLFVCPVRDGKQKKAIVSTLHQQRGEVFRGFFAHQIDSCELFTA